MTPTRQPTPAKLFSRAVRPWLENGHDDHAGASPTCDPASRNEKPRFTELKTQLRERDHIIATLHGELARTPP